jgi:hypothetical protein
VVLVEAVARVADGLRPGDATTSAAIIWAEAAGQISKAYRMRALRADKLLETLYQVELSHVPFPDEPPVLWPNAQVWRALTARRKKWASVDLRKDSPSEQHIESELDTLTNLDFTEMPLGEAMAFVGTRHNFTVLLDKKALEEIPIAVDQPITAQLAGITLRSALKIMLEPLELTYVIEDEVMKITTIEQAGLKLQTRVYPVADLVIPIQSFSGGGGGGMGGGGGGGIGGGGGGGGQFGGGGGGQFSVHTPAAPRPSKAGAGALQPGREVADPEVQGLLKNIRGDGKKSKGSEKTSRLVRPSGQAFAQVLDNSTDNSLKKKPLLSR